MNPRVKRLIAASAVAAVLGSAVPAAPAAASDNENWRIIKNAVREDGRRGDARREARWFKIVITDRSDKDNVVRVTLPLSLVEGIARLASTRRCRDFDADLDLDLDDLDIDVDIDFAEILYRLKKSGRRSLFELRDGGDSIRIWIE